MEVLRSWMEDRDSTDLRGRVAAALDTVDALLGLSHATKGPHMGRHHAPEPDPVRDAPPSAPRCWQ